MKQTTTKTEHYEFLGDYSFTETTTRVKCYGKSGNMITGFLKTINNRRRPLWEPRWDWNLASLVRAESKMSEDMIGGSEKYGFSGIAEGEHMLVRLIGDNSHMGKPSITHFFEPVITIRDCDGAIDASTGDKIITGVKAKNGEIKKKGYARGDVIADIPIVATFKTENFGEVGVGYVPRPKEEFESIGLFDKQPFYLKKVWIKNAAQHKGGIVKEAELLSNKGLIIAQR